MTTDLFDYQLLKSLVIDRKIHELYSDSITFTDLCLSNIHKQIDLYFLHNNNDSIDKSILITILTQLYKDSAYSKIIEKIYSVTINEKYISSLQETLLNRYIISTIHGITSEKLDTQSFDSIDDIIEVTHKKANVSEEEVSSLSLAEILEEKEGLTWPWESFNRNLGPLPPASHGLVFGRVEIGKTALITNLSLHFLNQGAVILHLNNEDPIGKLMERYYMIAFGVTKEILFKNLEKASLKFRTLHEQRLWIYDTAGMGTSKIDQIVRKIRPSVVFIDQLDGMSSEIDPSSLEKLYINIRNIAKETETRIISVTQASYGEHDWLGMGDVHNSKVGKQAALDYMIGIGGNPYAPLKRYISLPKNKLTGNHSHFTMDFDPSTMRMS